MVVSVALGIALFVGDFLRIVAAPAFHAGGGRWSRSSSSRMCSRRWTSLQDTGILVRERTEFVVARQLGCRDRRARWLCSAIRAISASAPPIATVIAFATRHVIVYSIAQRLWPVRYRWRPVLYVVGAALAAWSATLLLPLVPLVISIPVRVAIFAAYVLAVWHGPVLSARDRAAVARILRELATSLNARRRRALVGVGTDA